MKILHTLFVVGVFITPIQAQGVMRVNADAAPGGDGLAWKTAFTSIQDGIDAAAEAGGGEVWVAGGSYTNPADPETGAMLVLRPGVSLYGGFTGDETARAAARPDLFETRLDARTALNGGQADSVLLGAEGSTVDGFVVRDNASQWVFQLRADMTVSRCVFESNSGGAMRVLGAADVRISQVRFSGNEPVSALVGITQSPGFQMDSCLFVGNHPAFGPVVNVSQSADGKVLRSVFLNNSSTLFRLDITGVASVCPPVISGCWFEGNNSVFESGGFGPTVDNSVFRENVYSVLDFPNRGIEKGEFSEGEWPGDGEWPEGEVEECEGEPCHFDCQPRPCETRFSHCTFVGDADAEYVVLRITGEPLRLENNLFVENPGGTISDIYCEAPLVRHTLMDNVDYPGTGNLTGEPGFAGPGNLRLGAGSIAIGAGLDASLPEHGGVATDITGRPRGAHGAGFDLGAYQSGHAADMDGSNTFSLGELLRLIQFYNSPGFHCELGSEDGYAPGPGLDFCAPHSADYAPQDWVIGFSELLRVIQLYNSGAYHLCATGEDGFCPGTGTD